MVKVENLVKTLGEFTAVGDVSLDVAAFVVVGSYSFLKMEI